MRKYSIKIIATTTCLIGLSVDGCTKNAGNYSVRVVDRNVVMSERKEANPLRLILEVSGEGKLRLNNIETGSLDDTGFLSEKLKTIFADREKASIGTKEIIVIPQTKVEDEKLKKLISDLAISNATSILVVRDQP